MGPRGVSVLLAETSKVSCSSYWLSTQVPEVVLLVHLEIRLTVRNLEAGRNDLRSRSLIRNQDHRLVHIKLCPSLRACYIYV